MKGSKENMLLSYDNNKNISNYDINIDKCRYFSDLLKIISQPQRLFILILLKKEQHIVSEIEIKTGITQPMLSQYLGQLRRYEIVISYREGRQTFYKIAKTSVAQQVLALLDVLLPKDLYQTVSSVSCTDINHKNGHGAQFVKIL